MVYVVGLDQAEALVDLADKVQADVAPVLSQDELLRLIRVAAIADEDGNLPDAFRGWRASTAYAVRARVVPEPRNGYVYVATVAGQSGVSAPSWSLTIDATFTDGTVTWKVEDEADWVPTYCPRALNRAAAEGWRMKAAKLMANESFSADGATFNPQERRRDCLKMASVFARRGGQGTIDLSGSIYADYPGNVVRVS